MGFRDIAMFSDSLLAKQAWRLLKNPESLFYKVFKAYFFPNCTIMEAKHTSGGSHAWNSILHGRDVLLRGCRWRIGNGKAVSIWQHQWLPRKHPPQVLSPTVESLAKAKVALLINESTWQWHNEMIDGSFSPMEADLIKTIPLSLCEAEDTLFWPFTNNGVYNSKSRYRLLKAKEQTELEDEQRRDDKHLWRTLWSMQVPNKIKNLVWKACRNSLPTKENLVHRTIIDNPVCDQCKKVYESSLHALWSYGELDAVWEEESLWQCRRNCTFVDFKELLSWLITNQQDLELFSSLAWLIWTQRNLVRLNKPNINSHQLAATAKELVAEFA